MTWSFSCFYGTVSVSLQLRFAGLRPRPGPLSTTVCRSCLSARKLRQYSSAAIAPSPVGNDLDSSAPPPEAQANSSSSPRKLPYQINAAILLSRPPLLTRNLTPFEKAFFLYQRRLNERLALPFKRELYFEKRTPADLEFRRKMKERRTPARDIGQYSGYSDDAWNDEVVVGSKISEPEHQKEALVKDSEVEVKKRNEEGEEEIMKEEVERPMPRKTTADEQNDLRSLNRALDRTLYLVVKSKEGNPFIGKWRFPSAELLEDESLHKVGRSMIANPRMLM